MEFVVADEGGVVITLEPASADRAALSVPGGVAPGALHMTIVSIAPGTDAAQPDLVGLLTAVLPISAAQGPFVGDVVGGAFIGADGPAAGWAALFDIDDLADFQTLLSDALTAAGVALTDDDNLPYVVVSEVALDAPEALVGTTVNFDTLGVRYNGQVLLVPLSGAAAVPDAGDPGADPAAPAPTDSAPTPEAPAVPTPAAAATASVAPEDAIVGLEVSWIDSSGAEAEGIIANIDGLSSEPPFVTVTPEADPTTTIDLTLDMITSDDVEDALDDGADDPVDPADPTDAEDDVVVVDAPISYSVVAGHPDCAAADGGPVAVVATVTADDATVTESVESCWADPVAAQAHADELTAALVAPVADPAAPLVDPAAAADDGTTFIGESEDGRSAPVPVGSASIAVDVQIDPDGMSRLERASAMAANVRKTLDLLSNLSTSVDPIADEEEDVAPAVTALADREKIVAAMEAGDLVAAQEVVLASGAFADVADASDDVLLQELARRWAERVAGDVVAGSDPEAPVEDEGSTTVVEAPVVAADVAPVPEAAPVVEVDPATVPGAGEFTDALYDWEGILIVEGLPSGDGRMIAEQALTWRELPVPLMLQTINAPGHDGSIIAGSIHEIVRAGQNIMGRGMFDSGAAGLEARRLLTEGTMRGVSADIDSVVVEFLTEEGDQIDFEDVMFGGVDALEVLVEGRIMGATLTPFPAFQEAQVKVINAGTPDDSLVASGQTVRGDVWRFSGPGGAWLPGQAPDVTGKLEALVATGALAIVEVPVNPPAAWFAEQEMTEPQPFTVYPDGRCFGLVAAFGSCHIGFTDRCVDVPRSKSNYRSFRNKSILTDEGSLVACGPIFMDTVHPSLRLVASDAQAHYADTGCAVADVTLYENEFGIVAAGAQRTGLTAEQVRRFRGSDVSPDWRTINHNLDVVGLLSVNVSGFVVESLVASGASVSMARGRFDSVEGEVTALVAAGMIHTSTTPVVTLEVASDDKDATIEALTSAVESMQSMLDEFVLQPLREERVAAAKARLSAPLAGAPVLPSREERLAAAVGRFGTVSAPVAAHDCGGSCGADEGTCSCE